MPSRGPPEIRWTNAKREKQAGWDKEGICEVDSGCGCAGHCGDEAFDSLDEQNGHDLRNLSTVQNLPYNIFHEFHIFHNLKYMRLCLTLEASLVFGLLA